MSRVNVRVRPGHPRRHPRARRTRPVHRHELRHVQRKAAARPEHRAPVRAVRRDPRLRPGAAASPRTRPVPWSACSSARDDAVGAIDLTPGPARDPPDGRPAAPARGASGGRCSPRPSTSPTSGASSTCWPPPPPARARATATWPGSGSRRSWCTASPPTSALRRSLGMTDVAGRMAVLRRARLVRAQRTGFASREPPAASV